jgi:hypothetical protein
LATFMGLIVAPSALFTRTTRRKQGKRSICTV